MIVFISLIFHVNWENNVIVETMNEESLIRDFNFNCHCYLEYEERQGKGREGVHGEQVQGRENENNVHRCYCVLQSLSGNSNKEK